MKLLRSICVGISLVTLASCAARAEIEPAQQPKVVECTDRCTVRLGEIARFETMTLIPKEVTEDSRCPINAKCLRAGRVMLRATIGYDPAQAMIYHRTASRFFDIEMDTTKPAWMFGHNLVVDAIDPANIAGGEATKPEDYRITFSIEKADAPTKSR